MSLLPENQISLWYRLNLLSPGPAQKLGRLLVSWRRELEPNSPVVPVNISAISIPLVKVVTTPFSLNVICPPDGVVGQLLELVIQIKNQTLQVEELQLSVKENDAFIFSGQKKAVLKLLPGSTRRISYFLIPLLAGQLPFPQILLHSKRYLTDLLNEKNQYFVFVRPDPDFDFSVQI